MQPDEEEVHAAMEVFLDRSLQGGKTLPQTVFAGAGRLLHKLLPSSAFRALSR